MTQVGRFRVTFIKNVFAHGKDVDVEQRSFQVAAPDESVAADLAKQEFCRQEGLQHWWLHADRCEVERAC